MFSEGRGGWFGLARPLARAKFGPGVRIAQDRRCLGYATLFLKRCIKRRRIMPSNARQLLRQTPAVGGLDKTPRGKIHSKSGMNQDENQLKQAAAESAAAQVTDGMIVGLGSGTTAARAVNALGERVAEGLRIVGIPTSESPAAQAQALRNPVNQSGRMFQIDMTIDGADEVEEATLNLIKGHGGALLREKIVANATKRLVIVVDDRKIVADLGAHFAVPVEVVTFGWQATARELVSLGAKLSPAPEPGSGSPSLATAATIFWTAPSAQSGLRTH